MHILILSQWYHPEPIPLLTELAETLQSSGNQVTVLTGFPNYPSGKIYAGYRLKLLQRERIKNVETIRLPLYINHSRSGFKRAINYLSFALSAAVIGLFAVSKPTAIFVYHPPLTVGLPAIVLSFFWRVPFVFQIQDMWPETLRATGMMNNKHFLGCIAALARFVYKRAEAICVISNGFKRCLEAKGVPAEKIHVIYNWMDAVQCRVEVPDDALREQFNLYGKFVVMFAGNMGKAQALDTVIETAFLTKEQTDICFIFVGDGVAFSKVVDKSREMNLKNVLFLGRVKSEEMVRYYSVADVLLAHLIDDPLFSITIPSKLYTYMGCGKPILAALSGDAAELIAASGAGVVCKPQDPVAMAECIKRMYGMSIVERVEMGQRGRTHVLAENNSYIQINKIEALLKSVVYKT